MAPNTYYYFFSVMSLLGVMLYLISILYVRVKGKTIFGQEIRRGTAGYEDIRKLTSARGLLIPALVGLLLTVNLAYSADRVARINAPDARLILVFAPIVSLLIFAGALSTTRTRLGKKK